MIIIRADGNAKIGAGHLMRCLTIAQKITELSKNPERVCFFCADEASAEVVRRQGVSAEVLHTDSKDPETERDVWEKRLEEMLKRQGRTGDAQTVEAILVDSYYVTDRYLEMLRQYGGVYLMDDMQERVYPVDGVINYHVYADRSRYEKQYADRKVLLMLGADYVPLREQFRTEGYRVAEQVRDVLITTGGGDEENIAGRILDALWEEDKTYHVVVGRFHPCFTEWKEKAEKVKNIMVHHDVQDMAGLMRRCDLAVTAGGSTIYELAAVGVPFLCFSYAANQELLTEYIGNTDTAAFAGAWHKNPEKVLEELLKIYKTLCKDPELRGRYSASERQLTDGKGAERIARELLKKEWDERYGLEADWQG